MVKSRVAIILRRLWRIGLASAVAVAALGLNAAPATACTGLYPSFRTALSTAQRVVIGDVVAVHDGDLVPVDADGRSGVFTFRTRYVPRGDAPTVMEFSYLDTTLCTPFVFVRAGDRIALAFGATETLFGSSPSTVNTVAWIRGTPPNGYGAETITVGEVYGLLGLEPPDTSTDPPGSPRRPDTGWLLGLAAAMVGLLVGWRRSARVRPGGLGRTVPYRPASAPQPRRW